MTTTNLGTLTITASPAAASNISSFARVAPRSLGTLTITASPAAASNISSFARVAPRSLGTLTINGVPVVDQLWPRGQSRLYQY